MKLFFLLLSTVYLVYGAPNLQVARSHHASASGYQYNPPAGGYQYNPPAGGAAGIDVPVVATGSSHGAVSSGSHGAVSSGSHGAASSGSHGAASSGSHGAASSGSHGAASFGSHGAASSGSHGASISSSSHQSSSSSSSSHSASSSSFRASAPAVVVAILRDDRVDPDETGAYSFGFESEDGQTREEVGEAGAAGAVVQTGSYSYTLPDGTPFELKYIADENGFQPQSSFLPALPDFVLEQIAFAASEAAAGVTHSGGAVQRQDSAGHGGSVGASSGTSHSGSVAPAPSGSYLAPKPSNSYLTPQ